MADAAKAGIRGTIGEDGLSVARLAVMRHRRAILGLFAAFALLVVLASPSTANAVVFAVNSTLDSDDGSCSALSASNPALECTLREAINGANGATGADSIAFAIPGTGLRTIRPLSPLPWVGDEVVIDGYTQPTATQNTLMSGTNAVLRIELNGTLAGTGPDANGLVLGKKDVVRGLVVNGFANAGIVLHGTPLFWSEVQEDQEGQSVVEGNFIGTDVTGSLARPNGAGVVATSSENRIGGDTVAARNLISGNNGNGVGLSLRYATRNVVSRNLIGTTAAGNARLGNNYNGIYISAGAVMNHIGGNVIAANGGDGVDIFFALLGAQLGNNDATRPAASLHGNWIGTNEGGSVNLGNGGSGVQIGGANFADVSGNTIAFNGLYGVDVAAAIGIHVRWNSIFSNAELGIQLWDDYDLPSGITPNDLGDGDSGANLLQNYPEITSAVAGNGLTNVSGRLHSNPRIPHWIEVFSSPACDPSGHGEGRTLLGRFRVSADPHGNATFVRSFPVSVPVGSAVTATATDANDPVYPEYNPNVQWLAGDTSEFSPCVSVQPPRILLPEISLAGPKIVEEERGLTALYTLILSDLSEETVSVDFVTVDGTALAGIDYEPQKGTLRFQPGQTEKTVVVPLFTDVATEVEAFALELANPVNATIAGSESDVEPG